MTNNDLSLPTASRSLATGAIGGRARSRLAPLNFYQRPDVTRYRLQGGAMT